MFKLKATSRTVGIVEYLTPIKFRLPLIFAPWEAKIKGTELDTEIRGGTKIKGSELGTEIRGGAKIKGSELGTENKGGGSENWREWIGHLKNCAELIPQKLITY